MFAKENKRKRERSEGTAINLGRDVEAESWYQYIRVVFCLGLSVLCFSQRVRYSV